MSVAFNEGRKRKTGLAADRARELSTDGILDTGRTTGRANSSSASTSMKPGWEVGDGAKLRTPLDGVDLFANAAKMFFCSIRNMHV